ncbi:MAG: hypothetical protein MPK62_01040 [Alphaproteobacteria bacterium]|nr:hypothetical protein [Alphaproteobacteria bacterium]MDA8029720.1 hypothetical protein [Alphaproteobacteria bacterium]
MTLLTNITDEERKKFEEYVNKGTRNISIRNDRGRNAVKAGNEHMQHKDFEEAENSYNAALRVLDTDQLDDIMEVYINIYHALVRSSQNIRAGYVYDKAEAVFVMAGRMVKMEEGY